MRIQNVRDFAQTKPDSEINAPFLSNEHGDPQFFLKEFAKNSLIKNIFEEEKFDSRTCFFFGKQFLLGVFYPRRGLQTNHGTVPKSALFPQPRNPSRRKWSITAYVNKRSFIHKIIFCVFEVTKT